MPQAASLPVDHQMRIWDAIVLATAAEAGCELLLTEDLQDGFTWVVSLSLIRSSCHLISC